MPRDQPPVYNQHGQCISGSYMQATTAPRAPTPSTASYISDIWSMYYCEELSHHYCSKSSSGQLQISILLRSTTINRSILNMTFNMCETYLHTTSSIGDYWWILVRMLALLQGTLPLRCYWSQYYTQFSYLQLRQHPSRSTGQRQYYWFLENCLSTFVSTSQT